MEKGIQKESALRTWLIIILLVLGVLFQGFLSFAVVGDLGQPGWDYRPVKDVSGQSPYAVYQTLPYPQHVRGEKGE